MASHAETIDTVIIIHCSEQWASANFHHAYLALADALPPNAALICVDRPVDLLVAPIKRTTLFLRGIFRCQCRSVHDRLLVVRPWLVVHELLAEKLPGGVALNTGLLRRQLRTLTHRRFPNATRFINWIYYPHQSWTWEVLPSGHRVYHCYDEYTSTSLGEDRPDRRARETAVLNAADLTFVTSDELAKPRRSLTKQVTLFPNGVPESFLRDAPLLEDPIDAIPSPRICYLGQTYDFIRYRELHEIFSKHTEWQLIFIGPQRDMADIRLLRQLPNVHFVGTRPHAQLPSILPKCSVGLLPFAVNRYTAGATFLKLYAYMAAGLPIVSTDLPGLTPQQRNLFCVADDTVDGLAGAIQRALAADRGETRRRMHDAVAPYTWTAICRDRVVPEMRDTFGF